MKKSTNRVQLLKAVSVSVNEFYFSPSTVRKGKARSAIQDLLNFVEAVELPKAKPTPKAKPKASEQPQGAEAMMELFKQFLASQGMTEEQPKVEPKPKASKPKAKAKPKRRRKTTKRATPQQRVADRQEMAFHGKADTPVTPCATKRTASVEEAKKAAQEVSDKSGATARVKARAKARKDELMKAFQAKLDLEFPLEGTQNELSFSELSLRELAQLM